MIRTILVLIIFILFYRNNFSQEVFYVERSHTLMNGLYKYEVPLNLIQLDSIDVFFEGYLIIKNHFPPVVKSNMIFSNIFWVFDLNDIGDSTKHILYYPLIRYSLSFVSGIQISYDDTNRYVKNSIKEFAVLYFAMNHYKQDSCLSYLLYSSNIRSSLFNYSSKFWTRENDQFVYNIFKCSFSTAVMTAKGTLKNDKFASSESFQIFVPLSGLLTWQNLEDKEAQIYNFYPSKKIIIAN